MCRNKGSLLRFSPAKSCWCGAPWSDALLASESGGPFVHPSGLWNRIEESSCILSSQEPQQRLLS